MASGAVRTTFSVFTWPERGAALADQRVVAVDRQPARLWSIHPSHHPTEIPRERDDARIMGSPRRRRHDHRRSVGDDSARVVEQLLAAQTVQELNAPWLKTGPWAGS